MNTPDELLIYDADWLGCEALCSVPAFGLPQPAEQGGCTETQSAECAGLPLPEARAGHAALS